MKNTDLGIFITRIAIGFPMLVYGISKVYNGIDFIRDLLIARGLPPFLGYGVFLGEIAAPLLIIVGFRTRAAAMVFAFNCLTAICLAQTDYIFRMNEYGGWALELLSIYILVGIGLVFTGAGRMSLSTKSVWD